jgi:hypothetical protein
MECIFSFLGHNRVIRTRRIYDLAIVNGPMLHLLRILDQFSIITDIAKRKMIDHMPVRLPLAGGHFCGIWLRVKPLASANTALLVGLIFVGSCFIANWQRKKCLAQSSARRWLRAYCVRNTNIRSIASGSFPVLL